MKKVISILTTLVLSFVLVCSLSACKEIENGSEIKRVNFVLDFYDENGEINTTTVTAKLSVNFAPKTTEHVMNLISNGYYDGLCISNVTSTYAQFGDYKMDEEGKLQVADADVKTIDGEFQRAGVTGNRLSVSEGSILLKHSSKNYNDGKATLVVCFSTSAPFDAEEYCVIGKFVSDDADTKADSSSLEALTSLGRIKKIAGLVSSDDGRKILYNKTENKYYTYDEYEEEKNYYNGLFTQFEIAGGTHQGEILTADEVAELEKSLNATDGKVEFFTIPVNKVIVKSASLVK